MKSSRPKLIFLGLHRELHLSEVLEGEEIEVDSLPGKRKADEYAIMPTGKDKPWHGFYGILPGSKI
uniref:hypothetical protein n=1 Tax=Clostridium sp. NkU-1 TaxID=1095009 RepID=UPI0006D2156F